MHERENVLPTYCSSGRASWHIVQLSEFYTVHTDLGYMSRKLESFQRLNTMRETNGNFDTCNSRKRLVPSRLHELHVSKVPFVSRIEFICSKFSNFSAHVSGVTVG